ncbi:MAG: hypothetical protein M3251_00025 [Thermoproteota archaeon]|nr:hypothetical protein [Thermoproteota archaeon]MDQ3887640.1 hypothetical protein [Thermoproteota archaeon]
MILALEAGPTLLPKSVPKVVIDQAFEKEKEKEYFGGTGSISVYRSSHLSIWSSTLYRYRDAERLYVLLIVEPR